MMGLGLIYFFFFFIFREVPNELIKEAKGGEVNLDMEDHRTEDYVQPKVPVRAFTGEGHMLGRYGKNC